MWLPFSKRSKTKRERYREWRESKRRRQAERIRAALDRECWYRFFSYLLPHRRALLLILGLGVIGGMVGLILPHTARFVLDDVVQRRDLFLLNSVIISAVLLYLLQARFRYWEQKMAVTLSLNVVTRIREDLFRRHLSLPLASLERLTATKLMSRPTYSIFMIKMLIERFAQVCFRELMMIGAVVLAAALIDFKLTLILLALIPMAAFYVVRLNRAMAFMASRLQTKNDEILRILDRAFHSIRLYHIFGGESAEAERFTRILMEDKAFRIERTMIYVFNSVLVTFAASAIALGALWYGGRQIILGHLTYGDVVGYLICLGTIIRPIAEFVRASAYFQAGKIGIRTVFSLFEISPPETEGARRLAPKERKGALEFRNIWFGYGRGRYVLRNLSFVIRPGQKVLVIGRTGEGKSTLLNLLLRLVEPERGSILIDGVNLRRLALSDLRSYFNVVVQDDPGMTDSIVNNILLGEDLGGSDPDTILERAMEIAQKSSMNRLITSRERRYGSNLGNGGGAGPDFSRGELKKFAIMRATRRNDAPIVLLDDPLTSLDSRSQKEVVRLLEEQFTGRTRLILSAVPLPALKADWILVLRKGGIEVQGKHPYLMEHSNHYRELVGKYPFAA